MFSKPSMCMWLSEYEHRRIPHPSDLPLDSTSAACLISNAFFLLMSSISKSLSHLTDCTKYFSNFTWGHSSLITQHDSHQQVIIPFASHPHYPQKWFGVSRCTILEMSASMGLYFVLQRSLWNLEDEKHFNTCSRETTENANIDGAMCEIVITGLCSSSHTCPTPLKMEIVP